MPATLIGRAPGLGFRPLEQFELGSDLTAQHPQALASMLGRGPLLPLAAQPRQVFGLFLEGQDGPFGADCLVQIVTYAKPAAAVTVYCDLSYLASVRSPATKRAGLNYAVENASEDEHRALAEILHATPAAVLLSGYPSRLYEELYAGRWRLERTVQRPTSNTSGGRGAATTEVVWSNRPLPRQARLLDHPGVLP